MKKISRMWQTIALAVCVCSVLTLNAQAGYLYVLNTQSGAQSRIYGFAADAETGALTALPGFPYTTGNIGTGALNSEMMAVDSERLRLYVLNDGPDTLSVYSIDPSTGAIAELPYSPLPLPSATWCTVAVHPSGSPVIVGGTSGTGIANSFFFANDWAFPVAGSPFAIGSANPYSSTFSPDGGYYYAGGFSLSTTFAGLSVDAATGSLSLLPGSPYNSGGARPTGFSMDNQGRLYSADQSGRLRIFTTTDGVPSPVAGSPFPSLAGSIDTVLHPDGEFLFVTGRTVNQLQAFRISGSGDATVPQATSTVATGGLYPSVVTIARSGRLLFVGNTLGRNVGTVGFDPGTGQLTLLGSLPASTIGTSGAVVGMALFEAVAPPPPPSQTPAERVQAMVDTISSYDPPLQRGIARALIAKLESVLVAIETDDLDDARSELRAFMDHLNAQSGKHVPADAAAELLAAAESLLAALEPAE